MNTPIADFVNNYARQEMSRFHMPGHKGAAFLGCETLDITEVKGADSLYEADGIIAESEANAAEIFGTGRTVYSTEGSSQCIRAMLYLVMLDWKEKRAAGKADAIDMKDRPVVVAARNVHKAFVYAAALLDFEVVWLWPEGGMNSLCSCQISKEMVGETLAALRNQGNNPAAVYLTSPDYLGQQQDIKGIAEICHKYDTILAVDNAHGAYLHFTEPKLHPIDLGADICSDSAHKTLPVLTGGAYLQISKNAPDGFKRSAKSAMALFGSTSPSYLTMISLDLGNKYLSEGFEERLKSVSGRIKDLGDSLNQSGWRVTVSEPLKMTIEMPDGINGCDLAEYLRENKIECEYADPDFVVFMFTTENTEEDFRKIERVFEEKQLSDKQRLCETVRHLIPAKCQQVMSPREAVFSLHEEIPVQDALGRICASPAVSCPPAIPIAVSGERIDENAIALFEYYEISMVDVIL